MAFLVQGEGEDGKKAGGKGKVHEIPLRAAPLGEVEAREKVRDFTEKKDRLKALVLREGQLTREMNLMDPVERFRFVHPYMKEFKPYFPERDYGPGELIFNPAFGLGRVTEIEFRGKMRVYFHPEVGPKILAFTLMT